MKTTTKTALGGFAMVAVALGAAACTSHSSTPAHAAPGPTVTETIPVAGPTQTVTKSPPPPPTGSTVATLTGSGTAVTKSFNVPASGDFVVQWTYSGNDSSGSADNFIVTNTGAGLATSLPNDIATSGHGSTEVTGDSGTESFNVQADSTCSWTITVVSAS